MIFDQAENRLHAQKAVLLKLLEIAACNTCKEKVIMKKVVLAYSGGLDTSCLIRWLKDKGYEVIAFMADVGQGSDFKAIEKRALATGASKVYILDLKQEFVKDYVFPAIKANAVYEGKYFLATALSRPLIAKHQVAGGQKRKSNGDRPWLHRQRQ